MTAQISKIKVLLIFPLLQITLLGAALLKEQWFVPISTSDWHCERSVDFLCHQLISLLLFGALQFCLGFYFSGAGHMQWDPHPARPHQAATMDFWRMFVRVGRWKRKPSNDIDFRQGRECPTIIHPKTSCLNLLRFSSPAVSSLQDFSSKSLLAKFRFNEWHGMVRFIFRQWPRSKWQFFFFSGWERKRGRRHRWQFVDD